MSKNRSGSPKNAQKKHFKRVGEKKTGVERKREIVRAAISLFSEKGFRGTTTRELAEKSGVSEALLFRHFPDKKSLYEEILSTKMEESCLPLLDDLDGDAPPEDLLLELAKRMTRQTLEDPSFLRLLFFSALERHELTDLFFQRRHLPLVDFLIRYFEKLGQEKPLGDHRSGFPPELLARTFLNMIHGYLNTLLFFRIPLVVKRPTEESLAAFVSIFLKGIFTHA